MQFGVRSRFLIVKSSVGGADSTVPRGCGASSQAGRPTRSFSSADRQAIVEILREMTKDPSLSSPRLLRSTFAVRT